MSGGGGAGKGWSLRWRAGGWAQRACTQCAFLPVERVYVGSYFILQLLQLAKGGGGCTGGKHVESRCAPIDQTAICLMKHSTLNAPPRSHHSCSPCLGCPLCLLCLLLLLLLPPGWRPLTASWRWPALTWRPGSLRRTPGAGGRSLLM